MAEVNFSNFANHQILLHFSCSR